MNRRTYEKLRETGRTNGNINPIKGTIKTDTTKHTPGPWNLDIGRTISTRSGDFFISYGYDKYGNPHFKNFCELDANVHFIVEACNNYECVKAERDELAAALKEFVSAEEEYREVMSDQRFDDPLSDAYDKARAALAKLEAK